MVADLYERQVHWWKAHKAAAEAKAEKKRSEAIQGLTFKPRLVSSPSPKHVREMPQSPRMRKQASLHVDRQEKARNRKPNPDPRGPLWSPPESRKSTPPRSPRLTLDLTAVGSSSSPGRSPKGDGYAAQRSTVGELHGSYVSAHTPTLPLTPPRSPRATLGLGFKDEGGSRRGRGTGKVKVAGATGGGLEGKRTTSSSSLKGSLSATRQSRANAWEDTKSSSSRKKKSVRSKQAPTDVGSALDDDDDEEELRFYEQLQRERRDWARERAQLQTVIELQQRELGKRGSSVQERAAEIARDFSKSVLSFEERLLAVETSLHSEMKDLRQMMQRVLSHHSSSDHDADVSMLHSSMPGETAKASGNSSMATASMSASPAPPSGAGAHHVHGRKGAGGHHS